MTSSNRRASRCSSSARTTRSSASSSRTSRAAASARFAAVADGGRRADGALPRRRERRAVGRGLRGVRRRGRASARSRMIIGEAGAVTELWEAARGDVPPSRARIARTSPSTRSTSRRRPGEHGASRRRRRTTSTGSCRPAPPRTSSSSGSTRWHATPTAFAGARRRRSTRGARGSGWRTASCCSRPKRPRGRRRRCRSSRCGSTPRCAAAGTAPGPARPLPAAPRDDAERHPLRPQRERAGDRALRGDRDAQGARVPQHSVLSPSML